MNKIYALLVLSFICIGCNQQPKDKETSKVEKTFNQELVAELERMVEIDQIAAYIPQGKYKELSKEAWSKFKDSVFTTHEKRVQEIFKKNGFVGFDLAGEEGSSNFWVLVQHADHNPNFQSQVLEKMKIEVDRKNANPSNYGLLVDRVQLNTGKAQIYGTQVQYNRHTGQAYPKKLQDSIHVNERRKTIGLEPLEVYLNDMSKMHFEINKKGFVQKGITEAKLYKVN